MTKERGRPTKYEPEFPEMLVDHMAQGYSFESFGAIADCCADSLYEWKKVHPNFSDAHKKGKLLRLRFYEELGLDGVKGEREKFNAAAWIFTMKAQFNQFGWKEKKEIDANVNGNLNMQLVDILDECKDND